MEKNRIGWIDSLRFIAIFWVMTTHYISLYHKHWLVYWEEGFTSFFLQGLTGKFAVAVFCLLMGYFAARKMSRNYSVPGYIAKRYIQFTQGVLFMNIVLALGIRTLYHFDIVNLGFRPDAHSLFGVLHDSFLFSSEIVLPFWCIGIFFLSSVLLAFIYKTKYKLGLLGVVFLFLVLTQSVWIGLCIMGAIFYEMQIRLPKDQAMLKNPFLHAFLLLISFVIIQRPEGIVTFWLYGLSGFIILFVFFQNETLQKMLDIRPLRFLGSISFEFYLVHIPIQTIISFYIYLFLMNRIHFDIAFILSYVLTVGIDILLAYIYHRFLTIWILSLDRALQFVLQKVGKCGRIHGK